MTDSYEEVLYPGYAYPQTHPSRMAAVATLFGMEPPPVERCRVLDLGCGDGANLIPMAYSLPAGEFVGIDLADRPIRCGRELASALGLDNITLRTQDLRDAGADLGSFDYIIAYGLYSWVPRDAQDRILAIAAELLSPNGVAYVNYNAYPGGHQRMMVRQMLLARLAGVSDPRERISRAREFLTILGELPEESNPWLVAEARRLLERKGEVLYHDELGEHFAPVWFRDFAESAARHGLQYLGEAEFSDMSAGSLPASAVEAIDAAAGVIEREELMDSFKGRHFRQTLLCRDSIELDRVPTPERCRGLFASSEAAPQPPGPDGARAFRHSSGRSLTTSHPLAIAAMLRLAEAWPGATGFDDLLERCDSGDANALGHILLRAAAGGMVSLDARAPRAAPRPGERPLASPVARVQLQAGAEGVATLRHSRVNVTGALERRLILLLDGTRDRAVLARELTEFNGSPIETADLEPVLEKLARFALLLG